MSTLESKVLSRAIGRFGGSSSSHVALLMPDVSHEETFQVSHSRQMLNSFFSSLGESVQEFPSNPEKGLFSFLMGSGALALNPTLVHVAITEVGELLMVSIRAVAKEGLIQQHSAQQAVNKLKSQLSNAAA